MPAITVTGSGPEIDRHREWPREMGTGHLRVSTRTTYV